MHASAACCLHAFQPPHQAGGQTWPLAGAPSTATLREPYLYLQHSSSLTSVWFVAVRGRRRRSCAVETGTTRAYGWDMLHSCSCPHHLPPLTYPSPGDRYHQAWVPEQDWQAGLMPASPLEQFGLRTGQTGQDQSGAQLHLRATCMPHGRPHRRQKHRKKEPPKHYSFYATPPPPHIHARFVDDHYSVRAWACWLTGHSFCSCNRRCQPLSALRSLPRRSTLGHRTNHAHTRTVASCLLPDGG